MSVGAPATDKERKVRASTPAYPLGSHATHACSPGTVGPLPSSVPPAETHQFIGPRADCPPHGCVWPARETAAGVHSGRGGRRRNISASDMESPHATHASRPISNSAQSRFAIFTFAAEQRIAAAITGESTVSPTCGCRRFCAPWRRHQRAIGETQPEESPCAVGRRAPCTPRLVPGITPAVRRHTSLCPALCFT